MIGQTNKAILKNKLQRKLRQSVTDAEQSLRQALRSRQISGYKFRRQHPFGDFIPDFVCLEKMPVIEIDGGRHAERQASDNMRAGKLVNAGFNVLRFWNHEVLGQIEAVKESIWLELQKMGEPHPHLNPLPDRLWHNTLFVIASDPRERGNLLFFNGLQIASVVSLPRNDNYDTVSEGEEIIS